MATVNDFHKAIGFNTYSPTTSDAISIVTTAGTVEATKATITVLGNDVRYRYNGLDPTTTAGHYLGAGNQRELFGHTNLDQFRMIAVAGTATVTVTIEEPE